MTTTCPQDKDMDVFFSGPLREKDTLTIRFHEGAGFCIGLVDITQVRELLDGNNGLLLDWLSEEEQKHISRYRFPKRASEWLGGRIAAKAALLRGDFLQGKCEPGAITILADEHGRPIIMRPQRAQMVQVSISHSSRYGVGMASFHDCGVDIQRIESRIAKLGDHIGTEREVRMATKAVDSLLEGLTLLWATKEALKKCCLFDRPGLCKASIVERISTKEGNCRRIVCRLADSGLHQEVWGVFVGGYVLAWCGREKDA
ncbi:MAG TPA: 4'-phosphopantetheinyl transferase superfamily protein [Desulfobulbaceae bacterium]|nr:4'-phosphopantetheinyl transferase superfamily protein [Desulfobulbaceae bacterium]